MSITDDLLNFQKPQEQPSLAETALEEIESKRHNAFADLGDMLYDYAKGALQGADEVGRAATQVGAVAPEALDDMALEPPSLSPEQQKAVDWYDDATYTFKDETVKPVAITAALLGGGYGALTMAPFIINDTVEQAKEKGLGEAAIELGKNMVPLYSSVQQAQDPDFNDDGYKQAKNLEDVKPFRGAYETEVTPLPTSYPHPVRIHQIIETANSIVPVRAGRLKGGRNLLGYHMTNQEGVRIRSFQQFDTISHEIGHNLDKRFQLQGHDQELVAGAKSVWKHNEYKKWELRGEGIAEFTAVAQKNFPGYYKDFIAKLAEHPQLQKKVDILSNQIRKWYIQSEEARVRGSIVVEGDITTSLTQKAARKVDAVKNAWIDDTTFFREAIKDFEPSRDGISYKKQRTCPVANALRPLQVGQ